MVPAGMCSMIRITWSPSPICRRTPALPVERSQGLVDHVGGPEEPLEDRVGVLPETVCLLPVVDPGAEDAEPVDRAASRRGSSVVAHDGLPLDVPHPQPS